MNADRTITGDWHDGKVPPNVALHGSAHIETSYSFRRFHSSRPNALTMGKGAAAHGGTMFDLGPSARLVIGDYSLLNGVRIISDSEITIGDHCLISWDVVIMDAYRLVRYLAQPVRIENNVWIGFGSCVLPGVTIGEGSIIGARSVVTESVPPYTLAAGNPARHLKPLHSA